MTSINTVIPLRQPDNIDDPLTAVLRSGARRLLAQAIEAEADAFLATFKECTPAGWARSHGSARPWPERFVQTGIANVCYQIAWWHACCTSSLDSLDSLGRLVGWRLTWTWVKRVKSTFGLGYLPRSAS